LTRAEEYGAAFTELFVETAPSLFAWQARDRDPAWLRKQR
jgi:hypothetical protein